MRDGEDAWFGRFVHDERIGGNLLLDTLLAEFAQRNWPDDAQVIAGRHQENRIRAGHDDGVQNRHMTVTVHHHGIARRNVGMPNHLVRGRGAVGDEKAMIGIEDARGIALRCRNGPTVIEQLPQFIDSVANVRT